jgi:hypothetical protein
MQKMIIHVQFDVEMFEEERQVVIECPNLAARDFMSRALEEQILIKVKPNV